MGALLVRLAAPARQAIRDLVDPLAIMFRAFAPRFGLNVRDAACLSSYGVRGALVTKGECGSHVSICGRRPPFHWSASRRSIFSFSLSTFHKFLTTSKPACRGPQAPGLPHRALPSLRGAPPGR